MWSPTRPDHRLAHITPHTKGNACAFTHRPKVSRDWRIFDLGQIRSVAAAYGPYQWQGGGRGRAWSRDVGYKTVMACLALDRSNEGCLAVAGDLAERFDARIVGIAAADVRPTLYFAEGSFAETVLEEEATAIRKRLSELETEFRVSVSSRAKAVEWRSALTLSIPYVMQHARAADVLVVGQRAETLVDPSVAADPSDLAMQAGR